MIHCLVMSFKFSFKSVFFRQWFIEVYWFISADDFENFPYLKIQGHGFSWQLVLTNSLIFHWQQAVQHLPLPVHCEFGSMHLVLCIAVNLVFYWPYLKKVLEVGFFSSQTCVTAKQKKHVNCTLILLVKSADQKWLVTVVR